MNVLAVPSSSEDESEKLVSETTQLLRTVEPINISEKRRFSETIAIEHKERFKEMQIEVAKPARRLSKSEIVIQQPSALQGVRKEVKLPPVFIEQKIVELKQRAEAVATERQTLNVDIAKQRRYSETLAIDHKKMAPVQLTFDLPKHIQQKSSSVLTVQQKSAPKGLYML